jgi:hypothetical protein
MTQKIWQINGGRPSLLVSRSNDVYSRCSALESLTPFGAPPRAGITDISVA